MSVYDSTNGTWAWNFGVYSETSVTANVIVDGANTTVTKTAAQLKAIDLEMDPHAVLVALNASGETLRYQFGVESDFSGVNPSLATLKSSNQVTIGSNGEVVFNDPSDMEQYLKYIELSAGGSLIFNGTELSSDTVGYELQTLVISDIQEDISALNQLVTDLSSLDTWLQDEEKIEKNGKITIDCYDTDGSYYKAMTEQFPSLSAADRKSFLHDTNNSYVEWMGLSVSTSNDPGTDYRFGTHKLEIHGRNMEIYANDFSNAQEEIRNLVKEKSTQAEQLSTDFQTRNSRYNSLVEAMSSYASTYFDALKGLNS
ncbi:hypothetical protein [Motilimonas pumila]|uniref:Uncharacterized protein n=1 Tax=Motilimonas pumila TaxID=2303987 RepID=A0A418YDZ2_9GAMM|nr:hypothetical protein [Motilimonas pumila]RJG42767.1 hypothetical protein D1Z90_11805 [Motilimonas pumila]